MLSTSGLGAGITPKKATVSAGLGTAKSSLSGTRMSLTQRPNTNIPLKSLRELEAPSNS